MDRAAPVELDNLVGGVPGAAADDVGVGRGRGLFEGERVLADVLPEDAYEGAEKRWSVVQQKETIDDKRRI